MVAKWVGDIFNESVYEHLMEFKCFPYLPTQPPRGKVLCTAAGVMASDVITFSPFEKVSNIIAVSTTLFRMLAFFGLCLSSIVSFPLAVRLLIECDC